MYIYKNNNLIYLSIYLTEKIVHFFNNNFYLVKKLKLNLYIEMSNVYFI